MERKESVITNSFASFCQVRKISAEPSIAKFSHGNCSMENYAIHRIPLKDAVARNARFNAFSAFLQMGNFSSVLNYFAPFTSGVLRSSSLERIEDFFAPVESRYR